MLRRCNGLDRLSARPRDRHSRHRMGRQPFRRQATLYDLACALCDWFLAFRRRMVGGGVDFLSVLQGLGGGMIIPAGMTILTHAAGPRRICRAMAIVGAPIL